MSQCGVEEGEVELELAGEVLVEDRLGHTGVLGDVVHRGRVVAAVDEDRLGRLEELGAALRSGHPLSAVECSVSMTFLSGGDAQAVVPRHEYGTRRPPSGATRRIVTAVDASGGPSARMPLAPVGEALSPADRTRYARHVILPGVGEQGQRRLRSARVLVVGAGGLGSPVLLYLAAAGVGRLTVVDDDVVDATNLQRQVVHGVADVGPAPRSHSAVDALGRCSPPTSRWCPVSRRLDADNVLDLVADHDVVVDGADNFPTRYLVGDACARLGVPHVWGSVYQHDAQVSVWWAGEGPCYRCVFPTPPPPGAVPSCSTGGRARRSVGAVGSVMAEEVVKLVVGGGEPLVGPAAPPRRLAQEWSTLAVAADPDCVVCGAARRPAAAARTR